MAKKKKKKHGIAAIAESVLGGTLEKIGFGGKKLHSAEGPATGVSKSGGKKARRMRQKKAGK